MDVRLSFLDNFVNAALARGAVPYSPPSYMTDIDDDTTTGDSTKTSSGFKIGPYEKPQIPQHAPVIALSGVSNSTASGLVPAAHTTSGPSATHDAPGGNVASAAAPSNQLLVGKNVNQVWGRKPVEQTPPPVPQATATQQQTSSPAARSGSITSMPASTSQSSPTATSTTSHSVAEPAAPVHREPTEKEKLAANLFGGVAGASSKTATATRRKSSGVTATTNPASTAPTQNTSLVDAHQSAGQSASPPTVQQSSQSSNKPIFDLLDMDSALPGPPPPSNTYQSNAYQNYGMTDSVNLLQPTAVDTFNPAPIQTTTTSPAKTPAQAVPLSVFDAFDDMSAPVGNASLPGLAPMHSAPQMNFGRPQPIYKAVRLTTQEFGGRWGHVPVEVKHVARLSPNIRNLEQLKMALTRTDNFSHVDSIPSTNEVHTYIPYIYTICIAYTNII